VEKEAPFLVDRRMIKALAHPTRADILNILSEGPSSPSRIAKQLDNVSLNLTSHHIKVLRELDCVELQEEVRHGGRTEHIYRLCKRPMFTAEEWQEVGAEESQFLTLDLLRKVSEEVQDALVSGGFKAPDRHTSRIPMAVDREGWDEVVQILNRTMYELFEAGERSTTRAERSGEELTKIRIVILQFLLSGSDLE
jgi:DNA-binding transcriptional ArsR family regulator